LNKKILLIIGVVLIGVVLFGLVVVPFLNTGINASMKGQWYNGEEPVGSPFAFVNPLGETVTHVEITVSWVSTVTNVDPTSFNIDGTVSVAIQGGGATLGQKTFTQSGESALSSSDVVDFQLSEILGNEMEDSPWTLVFTVHLTATVVDDNGDIIMRTWSGEVTYGISWSVGIFLLTGTIGV
jgi:hypothetical protein